MALENQIEKNPLNTPEQNAPTDPFTDSFNASDVKNTTETPVSVGAVNDINPQVKGVSFTRGADGQPVPNVGDGQLGPQTVPLPTQPESPTTPPDQTGEGVFTGAQIGQDINTVAGIPEDIKTGKDTQTQPKTEQQKFQPFSQDELTQAAQAGEQARARGVPQEEINKQLEASAEFQGRKRATEIERRGMRRELVGEIGEFVQQNPELLSDREAFNEMVGFDELPDFQQRIANKQFDTLSKQLNNPEGIFTGLVSGIDQNLDTPAYNQAKKRYSTFQGLSSMPANQVATAVSGGTLLMGSQAMNDLQKFNPEFFAQVNQERQEQDSMSYINGLGTNLYNNLTESAKSKGQLPKGTMDSSEFTTSTDEVKKQQKEKMQLVKQVDDHISKSIVSQLGDKAGSFLSFAAEQLNSPEILAQKKTVNDSVKVVENLQEQMFNTAQEVRDSVPDTAPESLIQAMISEKTKNIQTQLRTATNVARFEQAGLTSLVEQGTQNIGLVQTAFGIQSQQEAAFDKRQQQQFNNNLALSKFDLDRQQFAFGQQQAAGNIEAKAQQEAISQRIDLAKLSPEQRAFAMGQTSTPEQQKPNFWNDATTTNEGDLNNDTDWDLDLQKGDIVPSPINGTVELIQEQGESFLNPATGESTKNIQLRIRADDGSLVTFNHLDPSMLSGKLLVDGQKVTAGQPLFEGGNTGRVIPGKGGDGSHVDVRVIQNGKSLNGGEVRDYLKGSFQDSIPQPFQSQFTDVTGFAPTNNQEFGDSLLNVVQQTLDLNDFDSRGLSRLLSSDRKEGAIIKVEDAVNEEARKLLGTEYLREPQVALQVKRSKELIDLIQELENSEEGSTIGPFQGTAQQWLGRFQSPESVLIASKATNIVKDFRKKFLGSAVSESEKEFMLPLFPELSDSFDNYLIKVRNLRDSGLEGINLQRDSVGLPQLNIAQFIGDEDKSGAYIEGGNTNGSGLSQSEIDSLIDLF